ncbi:hypothetical protein AK830_g6428 [Neonectria ditissima]|uniref:Metallo-beta-lactamase domain-containing protein n=1 Tax=Neonectria ditissima TaxID=78410 RepID=A0A0P7BII3_9HYPO|nr:hypothetical protein AK830_g6428 [Neonectria ditissima]
MSSKHLPNAAGSAQVVLLDGGGFTTTDDTKIHANGHDKPYYFCNPVGPRRTLVDQLKYLDVQPEDIDVVLFSHAHWDHCRPVKKEFPNAKVFFGPGTTSHCSPGHIQDGQIMPMIQWDSRFFGDETAKTETYQELSGPWVQWGPFDKAMDYFGDGSLWIIQAPGHMAGNLAAVVRKSPGNHVILASDCCHSRDIFQGRKDIAEVTLTDGSSFCLHEDVLAARHTIDRLREAVDDYGMHMAMTHDAEWIKEQKDEVLMSILHPFFDEHCLLRIRAHLRP